MSGTSGGNVGREPEDENVFERLLEGATDQAMFMLDSRGRISVWPLVAQRLYGYDADDVIGDRADRLFTDEPEAEAHLMTLLVKAKRGTERIEGWHQRADGSVFWAECSISPLRNDDFDGYSVVCKDTTSRKQYERMLEQQNDRLKEFTDIPSHDLRTPLAVIDGRLQLFRQTGEEEHLEAVEATTTRIIRLIEDLLRVSRQGKVVERPEPADIGTVLETAREGALPDAATLEYGAVPSVMADSNRLIQVFENLLRNSAEHGGENVTVRIGPLTDGLYVADDGPGIPEEDRERIFEHGYTTREDGTGYGLSVVQSIVGAHGWDIEVVEAEDGGTRFEITGIEFISGA